MVNNIRTSFVENLVSDLVNSISSSHLDLDISSVIILKKIIWVLTPKSEGIVWKALQEAKTIDNIINHLINSEPKAVKFYVETFDLLSIILCRWPSFRFCVWSNCRLMEVLHFRSLLPIYSLKAAVLNLYSSIALCDDGAKKLLDAGSLQLMVNCMDGLNPDYLKLVAFRLAECFVVSEEGRTKMIELYCEPLVKAIVDGLSNCNLHLEKPTNHRMLLIKGVCCVSKIICWPGKHHSYFWNLGIESVILKLLPPNSHISEQFSTTSQDGLNTFLHELKPYVWDILGGLATHCAEELTVNTPKSKGDLKILITSACIGFVNALNSLRTFDREEEWMEPVCKSVLLMIFSPSKDIARQVKSELSEKLKKDPNKYIRLLLTTRGPTCNLQVIKLLSLACYSGLPRYRLYVRNNNGMKILLSYVKELLSKNIFSRLNTNTSPLFFDQNKNACCYESEDNWTGDKMFLVLLVVAELIQLHVSTRGQLEDSAEIMCMHAICINYSASSGPRWYAAYILSHFGVYGFPSKYGNKILNVLSNPAHINVDDLVVRIRCKKLESTRDNVDKDALKKLLEFVYKGYLESGNQDLVKSLITLAKEYNLHDLAQILDKSRPIWRKPYPRFDLTSALEPGPDDLCLSDIVLEPKYHSFDGWKCKACSLSDPHLHAHKAIICSSCDYINGMLHSGMQESRVNCITADVGWEALVKLLNWFYSGELVGRPKYGCLWRNLDSKEKIKQMIPYVELYCLSDFWLLEDLKT